MGVILDSKLHFDLHVDNVVNKAYRMYGFVMRSSNDFKRPNTYITLYKTLIRSQLEYAVPIWCPFYNTYVQKLEMIQKKFLRSMQYKCHLSKLSYIPLLKQYKLISLESRRTLLMVSMLHGLCNNKFDCTDLTNQLCYIVPRTARRREARAPQLFHTVRCRTNAGARAPLRRLFETYNTHFEDLDIFSLSQTKFKSMAIKMLE